MTAEQKHKNWAAELELGFSNKSTSRDHQTVLSHRRHSGPLRVQKPLYPEQGSSAGACHVMILHPPAGIASGDSLNISVDAQPHSHAVITTPGAGKWYGGNSTASQRIRLNASEDALIEWVPQEAIVFNHAYVDSQTTITLHPSAALLAWDIAVFGRKLHHENFTHGQYRNHICIYQESTLILDDLLDVAAAHRWFSSPLGMHGKHVLATFWAMAPLGHRATLDTTVHDLRQFIQDQQLDVHVTQVNELLIVRHIGSNVRPCFDSMNQIRAFLRKHWFGFESFSPRIWNS